MKDKRKFYAGYIAIVGRPNVGKSTLLNHLIQQKISITSRKPQTTRNNVIGIKTVGHVQMVFVDTPGIHKGTKAINRQMNRSASSAIQDVDLVLFVVDKAEWTDEDKNVLDQVKHVKSPIVVVVNKVDQVENKSIILPVLQRLSEALPKAEIVPLSALKGTNLDVLEKLVIESIPENTHFYPEDQVTDRNLRFLVSEIIREKLIRQLGEELPHQTAVEIEEFVEEPHLITISAAILVERKGQKSIVIGDGGSRVKSVGQQARIDIERLVESKVMLNLWVKVKSGWSDDERALKSLGLNE